MSASPRFRTTSPLLLAAMAAGSFQIAAAPAAAQTQTPPVSSLGSRLVDLMQSVFGPQAPAPVVQPATAPPQPAATPPAQPTEPQAAPTPRTFTVATATELNSAIVAARAGDTILVAGGDYGNLRIFRRRVADGHVRIRPASPTSRPRFASINLEGSAGYHFDGIDVAGSASPLVRILSAADIQLNNSRLRGANANQDPWDDQNTAVWVRSASNVTLAGNDYQDLKIALLIQNTFDVVVTRSSFTHLREGINVASLGRGTISGNHFHSFSPNYGLREHPDAIQFWTRGESWGSHDITLANNFFALGGQRAIHGIFIRSEEAESYNRPVFLRNFTITGNVYYGSALHGISLSSVHGARVTNNVAVASPWADQNNSRLSFPDGRSSGGLQPHIRAINGSDIVMERNVSMNTPGGPGVSVSDHIAIFNTHRRSGEPWTTVFAARPTADAPALSAFRTIQPSAAATRGIGMLQTFPVGTPAPAPATLLLPQVSNQPTRLD